MTIEGTCKRNRSSSLFANPSHLPLILFYSRFKIIQTRLYLAMGGGSDKLRRICCCLLVVMAVERCGFYAAAAHQCFHGHGHDHHHHHHHHMFEEDVGVVKGNQQKKLLPEKIAEEEDLRMMWVHSDLDHESGYNHNEAGELSGLSLWIHAMACSLLVSLASLVCLILLPLMFIQGKPSTTFVDSLALFGAGAMLGDTFLHQLPHAFGGQHSHSHDHHDVHAHAHEHFGQSQSHSLKDLSIGLSILGGIVAFLIVEKIVRYVEEFSGGVDALGRGHHHHHHHHHHKHDDKLKDDETNEEHQELSHKDEVDGNLSDKLPNEKEFDVSSSNGVATTEPGAKDALRKRRTSSNAGKNDSDWHAENALNSYAQVVQGIEPTKSQSSLVFGYLNLFSDGVHNFTDGMALGSAFLLYGSVGGWSRTLFLLAHELPQEIGDFGVLVRSGFSVSKALFFNFLSALIALAGTALALMWGKDPGQSSLIEGFTAGGFVYIALAGVVADMNSGSSALRHTITQLISLVSGMAVALCISLVE